MRSGTARRETIEANAKIGAIVRIWAIDFMFVEFWSLVGKFSIAAACEDWVCFYFLAVQCSAAVPSLRFRH